MLDWILDHYIYPSLGQRPQYRPFKTYNVGGSECLVVTREDATCWLLYCHGNSVTLDDLHASGVPQMLVERCKCNFVAPEFPVKSRSGRSHDEDVTNAAKAAYEQLCADYTAPVFVVGRSLGVGVALSACLHRQPAGLLLVSGFASIRNLAPTWLWYMLNDRFNNVKKVAHFTCPKIIVHGNSDELVPVEHAHLLYKAAQNAKMELLPMGHNPSNKNWAAIASLCSSLICTNTYAIIPKVDYCEY